MPSIKDQSVLVIGGSSGIGFAVAKLALEQGCRVSIASSNPERISNAVTRLTASSPASQISGHTIDLSTVDVEARLQCFFKAVTKDGTQLLDHVISTAIPPISMPKTLQEVDREELLRLGQFSTVVPMLIAKVAPNFMKGEYKSSLILTSGAIAEKPIKGWSVMVPGAMAFYGMVKALALDLAPRRVNLVSPGATNTELWGPSPEERAKRAEMMKGMQLTEKVGSPEEVAEAYIYLMRNWNATGSVVSTHGGSSLK